MDVFGEDVVGYIEEMDPGVRAPSSEVRFELRISDGEFFHAEPYRLSRREVSAGFFEVVDHDQAPEGCEEKASLRFGQVRLGSAKDLRLVVGGLVQCVACHTLVGAAPAVFERAKLVQEIYTRGVLCGGGGAEVCEVVEDVLGLGGGAVRRVVEREKEVAGWFAEEPLGGVELDCCCVMLVRAFLVAMFGTGAMNPPLL